MLYSNSEKHISPLHDWHVFSPQESCDGHWALKVVMSFMSPCEHSPPPRWTARLALKMKYDVAVFTSYTQDHAAQNWWHCGDSSYDWWQDGAIYWWKDHPENCVFKEQSAVDVYKRTFVRPVYSWFILISVTFVHLSNLSKLQDGPWHVAVLHLYLFIINPNLREILNEL